MMRKEYVFDGDVAELFEECREDIEKNLKEAYRYLRGTTEEFCEIYVDDDDGEVWTYTGSGNSHIEVNEHSHFFVRMESWGADIDDKIREIICNNYYGRYDDYIDKISRVHPEIQISIDDMDNMFDEPMSDIINGMAAVYYDYMCNNYNPAVAYNMYMASDDDEKMYYRDELDFYDIGGDGFDWWMSDDWVIAGTPE